MRSILKSVLRVLGSRELAATTMLAWAGLITVWVIPFIFYGLPAFQIKNIVYSESFFRIVYAVLALNTLACIVPRVPALARRVSHKVAEGARPRVPDDAARLTGPWDPVRAARALAAAGFRRTVAGDGWVWGVRNRYAPLGNLIFHAAFFVLIAGALVALDPRASYVGKAVVAEGETFDTATGVFSEEPVPREVRPPVTFTVRSLRPAFYRDILLFTALEAEVESDGRTRRLALSSPWIESLTSHVAIEDFGYVLESTWSVDEVGEFQRAYKLKVFPSGLADSFVLNEGGKIDYEVTVRVYSDYVDRQGKPGSRSFNLSKPMLLLDVARVLSSGGRQPLISERLVAPGEHVRLLDSVFTVDRVGYYGVFRIVDSWAAPVLFVGVVMLAAGTVMRLFFPRQEALIASAGTGVAVSVRDEAYRQAPGRLASVVEALERAGERGQAASHVDPEQGAGERS